MGQLEERTGAVKREGVTRRVCEITWFFCRIVPRRWPPHGPGSLWRHAVARRQTVGGRRGRGRNYAVHLSRQVSPKEGWAPARRVAALAAGLKFGNGLVVFDCAGNEIEESHNDHGSPNRFTYASRHYLLWRDTTYRMGSPMHYLNNNCNCCPIALKFQGS